MLPALIPPWDFKLSDDRETDRYTKLQMVSCTEELMHA